jgi:hypothetical protein
VGALWENYFIAERLKYNHNRRCNLSLYFWRTHDRHDIDYVEEGGGRLVGYECKWTEKRWQPPALFSQTYPSSEVHLVHRNNYLEFLTRIAEADLEPLAEDQLPES